MDNLEIYNQLKSVPEEAQKAFNNGRFSGTDINPMWRIKKLTETFGMAGVGWYTEIVNRHIEEASDGTKCVFVSINLYVKVDGEWSKPIYGEGGNTFASKTSKGYLQVSDEAYKMAYTDALGIAAKALGLGADVWFKNDKTKYTEQAAPSPQPVPTTNNQDGLNPKKEETKQILTPEELCKVWLTKETREDANEFYVTHKDQIDITKEPFASTIKQISTKFPKQQ